MVAVTDIPWPIRCRLQYMPTTYVDIIVFEPVDHSNLSSQTSKHTQQAVTFHTHSTRQQQGITNRHSEHLK